ncbi:prealbumin-like fold domain-containing protein, partial [Streptococcus pyogenes]
FVVRDADATTAKYLKIDDATKEISWVETYEEATKFTTGSDGIVDIKGLTYGTYYLEETQAPTDYVKLTERIDFTVEFDSYKT